MKIKGFDKEALRLSRMDGSMQRSNKKRAALLNKRRTLTVNTDMGPPPTAPPLKANEKSFEVKNPTMEQVDSDAFDTPTNALVKEPDTSDIDKFIDDLTREGTSLVGTILPGMQANGGSSQQPEMMH